VDDVYVFISSISQSKEIFHGLIPELRNYDLILNEAKTYIIAKNLLLTEEPDLEKLFDDAIVEITENMDDDDFVEGYGFQMDWEDDEDNDEDEDEDEDDDEDEEGDKEEDLELRATKLLFDSIPKYPGHEESIERFCIPIFQKAKSRHALSYAMVLFDDRPSMTQIYASYLSTFIEDKEVFSFMSLQLNEAFYSDWQKMWIIAALLQRFDAAGETIKAAYDILSDAERHDGLRAVAAILVGKFGDYARRRRLVSIYPIVSDYIKSAIYFSSIYWGGVEKRNARAQWGSQGVLNSLITEGMAK
ncbi:hypothetical protein FV226_27520, partial [Methylobacterium sp. WL12]|uniref:hypothetical protein n=1 Tax=Methylobacterium sp. WL12 TaxID=2603890 RepID=UPI0011D52E4F